MFFSHGPWFEGEDYEKATTADQRWEHWSAHRQLYIDQWHAERHPMSDRPSWGECLEEMGQL